MKGLIRFLISCAVAGLWFAITGFIALGSSLGRHSEDTHDAMWSWICLGGSFLIMAIGSWREE